MITCALLYTRHLAATSLFSCLLSIVPSMSLYVAAKFWCFLLSVWHVPFEWQIVTTYLRNAHGKPQASRPLLRLQAEPLDFDREQHEQWVKSFLSSPDSDEARKGYALSGGREKLLPKWEACLFSVLDTEWSYQQDKAILRTLTV